MKPLVGLTAASAVLMQLYIGAFMIDEASSGLAKGRVVMCYWGSWSTYRPGIAYFDTTHIDTNICTHLIYSFAGITNDSKINVLDAWNDIEVCGSGGKNNYKKAVELRKLNPDLKVLIAIGGWNEGSSRFSNMSSTAANRQTFIASVIKFLLQYDFDGLDLDWEYPTERGGKPEDRPNYTLLVKELRAAFEGIVREPGRDRLLLTAALPGFQRALVNGYELANISRYLDYLNIMTYDYHAYPDDGPFLFHHAGFDRNAADNAANATRNVKWTIEYLLSEQVPPKKIVLGFPTYGRTMSMADRTKHDIYDPAIGLGPPGTFTQTPGHLAYYELCPLLQDGTSFTVVSSASLKAPYAYENAGSLWISYEDPDSAMAKAQYAVSKGLGGAMVWSINDDDFRDVCEGIAPSPIVSTIRAVFETSPPLP